MLHSASFELKLRYNILYSMGYIDLMINDF